MSDAPEKLIADMGMVPKDSGGVEWERWGDLADYVRADVADARLERAVRAALEAAADLAQDMDMGVGTNPYAWPERISEAIRAIDPAQIVKGMKDE